MTPGAAAHLGGTTQAVSSAEAEAARRDRNTAEAAKQFEAVFLTQAVDEMMNTVDVGSFGGGTGEKMWKSFMSQAIADQIAETGTTGIAQSVEAMLRSYGVTK